MDPPLDDGFTPFLAHLEAPVEALLRKLFAVGPKVTLDWRPVVDVKPDPLGMLRVKLESPGRGDLVLELSDRTNGDKAWMPGKRLQLVYRASEDGRDPSQDRALAPLLVHCAKAFKNREAALADALIEKVDARRRFDGVEDWMYRQKTLMDDAPVGNLRLGFRCNQDCHFCWQDRGWPEPPHEYYFTWLEEMAGHDLSTLIITGGEPTVHKALPDLVDRAVHAHGMTVQLQTNAIQFRRPKFLQRMMDAGLSAAFVSFHSADPEISDRMTRARGTWVNTVKGIKAALEAGLPVDLNCVVEKQNVHTLSEHARFIVDEFVTPYPDNPIGRVTYSHPAAYYDRDEWDRAIVPLDEVRPHLVPAALTLTRAGVPVEVIGTCGFPPCLFEGEPELIRSLPAEKISPWDLRSRDYGEGCTDCKAKRHCVGLRRAYMDKYGERGIRPFTVDPDPPERTPLEAAMHGVI